MDKKDTKNLKVMQLVLRGIALAMGIAVTVLNILNQLSVRDAIIMLSIGLTALSLSLFEDKQVNK